MALVREWRGTVEGAAPEVAQGLRYPMSVVQRLRTVATGGRTHATRHEAVIERTPNEFLNPGAVHSGRLRAASWRLR